MTLHDISWLELCSSREVAQLKTLGDSSLHSSMVFHTCLPRVSWQAGGIQRQHLHLPTCDGQCIGHLPRAGRLLT